MCSLGIFFGAKERVVYNEGEDFFSLTEEHKNRFHSSRKFLSHTKITKSTNLVHRLARNLLPLTTHPSSSHHSPLTSHRGYLALAAKKIK